jgi:hypothetical protein
MANPVNPGGFSTTFAMLYILKKRLGFKNPLSSILLKPPRH